MYLEKVLKNIAPDLVYFTDGDVTTEEQYNNVKWIVGEDENGIATYGTPAGLPTWAEYNAELTNQIAAYDAQEYARKREAEYPSLQDCIHALLDGGDTLTELQSKRTEIKNKYPKE